MTENPQANSQNRSASRAVGGYLMPTENITDQMRDAVKQRLGAKATAFPAKENGVYKGPIIHAGQNYIVQAVGKSLQTAVVHKRADISFEGAIGIRAERNDLKNRNAQIHYSGSQAKAYTWDAAKEQEIRARLEENKQQERLATTSARVMTEAEKYAAENIKNPRTRQTFLKHLGALTQKMQQPQQGQAQSPASKEQTPNSEMER